MQNIRRLGASTSQIRHTRTIRSGSLVEATQFRPRRSNFSIVALAIMNVLTGGVETRVA
jgi:hypothetical protein